MPVLSPTLSKEEELHWLALLLVSGLGVRKAGLLLERFHTPQAIFRASLTELESVGLSGAAARAITSGCSFEDAVEQHRRMAESGTLLIPLTDPRYPEPLREIFDPPILLFVRGNQALLRTACFAMVGTRRPTPYGNAAAERLSADLARAGLTIVSGMARGIDTASHRGALTAGGNTIAVLGCGVDVVYPSENKKLAAEIAARGLLISEFPLGTTAFPQNFPIRNRIVSGLSTGLMVVEGAQYSGSGITAKLALDQGRDLFAVPGNITSALSWGPNLLIKQGAKLVQDWNDVVLELPPAVRQRLIAEGKQRIANEGLAAQGESSQGEPASLLTDALGGAEGEAARKVLRMLKTDTAIHLDDLLETLENCSSSELIAALFELEMMGLAKQLPGKNFVRVW